MGTQPLRTGLEGIEYVSYGRVDPAEIPDIHGPGRAQRWTSRDQRELEWVDRCGTCRLCRWADAHPGGPPAPLADDEAAWAEIRAALRNDPERIGAVLIERAQNARR
jgi:hypothetical protein